MQSVRITFDHLTADTYAAALLRNLNVEDEMVFDKLANQIANSSRLRIRQKEGTHTINTHRIAADTADLVIRLSDDGYNANLPELDKEGTIYLGWDGTQVEVRHFSYHGTWDIQITAYDLEDGDMSSHPRIQKGLSAALDEGTLNEAQITVTCSGRTAKNYIKDTILKNTKIDYKKIKL